MNLKDIYKDLDPWHYTYCKFYSYSDSSQSYIDKVMNKLQSDEFKDYPLYIGSTGYIQQMDESIDTNLRVKMMDNVGRNVFIIDDLLLFQRYVEGNIYVYGKLNNYYKSFNDVVSDEMWISLNEKL